MRKFIGLLLCVLAFSLPAQATDAINAYSQYQVQTPGTAIQFPVPNSALGFVLPQTISNGATFTSTLIVGGGWTKITVGAKLNQTGTITITRYVDSAGTISQGAASTLTLVANTTGVLNIADGLPFRSFTVGISNTSGSSGSLSILNTLLQADTLSVDSASNPQTVSVSNLPTTVDTNTGASSASTVRTVSASNDPIITAINNNAVTVPLAVTLNASTASGSSAFESGALGVSATKFQVKGAAGNAYECSIDNTANTVTEYAQIFDQLSSGVTLGSTTPTFYITLPASSIVPCNFGVVPFSFLTGLTIAITTTRTGSGAPANDDYVYGFYK